MEYSELRSLIVAVLMFCVPILAAIIDKRAKAKKRSPQVNAEPIDFEELERRRQAAAEGTRSIVRGPAASSGTTSAPEAADDPWATIIYGSSPAAPEPAAAPVTEVANNQAAAQPVAVKSRPAQKQAKAAKAAKSGQYPTAEEIKKDCKKLILYSEILKPKFDERD